MQLFVRDRYFYARLAALALPVAFQNLINFAVSAADTVMIGQLGEIPLSGVAQANQVGFIFMLFTFGLAGGCNVMIAQYWGRRDLVSIHKILTIMYRFLLCGAAIFTVIALFFPYQAMSLLLRDEQAKVLGVEFLQIVGFSYLLAGFNNVTVIVQRSVGSVLVSVAMSLTGLVSNILLNWLLIFDHPGVGWEGMGVQGAAIATCIARVLEFVVVVIYLARFEKQIGYRFRSLFMKKVGMFREFAPVALPVVINEIFWSLGMTMIAAIIGWMGPAFTAANSICTVLSQLVTIFIFGVGNASAVIIGNTIGRGEHEKARSYARTLLALSILLGLVASGLVLALRDLMISVYSFEQETNLLAAQIINVYAAVVIVQSFSAISLLGILRGGGDTRFALLMDLVFMWGLCIPLGAIAGLKLGLAVPVVYGVIKSDEFFKALLAIARIRSGKWVVDVTRASAREQ